MALLAPTPLQKISPVAGMIRAPGQLICPDGLVFRKAENFIRRHVAKLLATRTRNTCELFALIDGPAGTGKSVLATDGLLRAGFHVATISGAQLAGSTENAATEALSELLDHLVAYSHSTGARVAVVLDDFHQSIVGTTQSHVGRTVNSDLLTAELQRIADPPRKYRSQCGTPIPFIFTGNDFSHTAPSLFRDMRAARFTHEPTRAEKQQIIEALFASTSCRERAALRYLAWVYAHQPIAFWAALKNDLVSDVLDRNLPDGELTHAAVEAMWPSHVPLHTLRLWRLARQRVRSTPKNHYRPRLAFNPLR
ncbi:MAG: hypothetical protein APF80_11905 [Alphaproteobacteria bacterium BRH_c36]|nr:MAG: hypothetical protein APF80_11905 [Alphaproteobacteria bacterium BRH_c36]